jgi:hypothetical protein
MVGSRYGYVTQLPNHDPTVTRAMSLGIGLRLGLGSHRPRVTVESCTAIQACWKLLTGALGWVTQRGAMTVP